jgi:sugar lactone lactonase YvrE
MINSGEVSQKKQNVKHLVLANGIAFSSINDWLWICPKCGSGEVCSYRWNVAKDDSSLREGDDNLPINKS